jgi:bifunctional non-homologous end joining protein LigD
MYADHLAGRGDALAAEVNKRGGFGILARRADAPYVGGPSEDRVAFLIQKSDPPPAPAKRAAEGLSDLKVRLSNLDKIFWPEEGYTKGDLLRYYRAVAPWLLPHLIDRPLVLTRYPDGIHGKSFFQHNAPGAKSAWLRTVRIEMSKRPRDYFLADDLESLLYLVNLGTIPLHLWPSRVKDLDRPDWCCIDVDPGAGGFGDVMRVALAIRELCDAIELPTFPKTSGGSGLHVLIPLAGRLTYDQSRALGELISRSIADRLPHLATLELAIADRGGRVFLDHLVNARGRMLVSPYSVRPLPGATVSTPLSWDEVGADLDPRVYTMQTVPARLKAIGDPWRDMLATDVDIAAAIDRLGSVVRSRV